MTEKCIGEANKSKINNLENEIKLLRQEVDHVKGSMITVDTFHKMQLEITEIRFELKEMKNNRQEDRDVIGKLSNSIDEISSKLEEYLENNAQVLANQFISSREQDDLKRSVGLILNEIQGMKAEIKNNNLRDQFRLFYNKSKLNKWISRFIVTMSIILLVSIFSFFTSGGKTFFDILIMLKELIL
jgi:chromosome segregation ATPase